MARQPQPRSRDANNQDPRNQIASQFVGDDDEDVAAFGDNEDTDDDDDVVETADSDDDGDVDTSDVDKAYDDADDDDAGYYPADSKGNLVDKNGKVVASRGKERKQFEKFRSAFQTEKAANLKLTKALVELTRETKVLWDKYKEIKETKTIATNLGLNNNEEREALQLAAMAKVDPKGAIQKVLTIAQLRGIDLTDLGGGTRLDPEAVAEHTAKILADRQLAERHAEQNRQRELPDARQLEIDVFFKENPDALGTAPNGQPWTYAIAEAKTRYPHMSLDQIWYRIKDAVRNGNRNRTTRPVPSRQKTVRRKSTKGLSLEPVHPSTSFNKIAEDLLRDLKADER